MSFYQFVVNYFEGGSLIDFQSNEAYLRRAGFIGYFSGTLTFFISLKVMDLIPGGVFSFLTLFSIILGINYFFSAVTDLFMDMLGHRYSSSNLFYYFGFSEYAWLPALPLSFMAKTGYLSFGLFFSVLFFAVWFLRLKIIKMVYGVRYKMAFLSFIIPYMVFSFVLFFGFIYAVYWIVALLIK